MNLYEEINRQKRLMGFKIDENFGAQTPTHISPEEANQILNSTDEYIYISTEPNAPLDNSVNTFMLNSRTWDGSLNIYKHGTPKEYGLQNIINWLKERGVQDVQFYTLHSNQPLTMPLQ